MVTEVIDQAPITQDEIDAVKAQLLESALLNLDEIKGKNSAVLTVMMPLPLRVMIDDAALEEERKTNPEATAKDASAADWARGAFAQLLGYTLPVKGETRTKKNKRSVEVQQRAQRAMVSELIAKARRGEIDL